VYREIAKGWTNFNSAETPQKEGRGNPHPEVKAALRNKFVKLSNFLLSNKRRKKSIKGTNQPLKST